MTQDQALMLLRMALQGIGTFLIAKNVFTAADWTLVVGAILQVVPVGWSFWARREAALKASVSSIPDTMVVTVHPSQDHAGVATSIARIPEVQTVISTPEVAAATISDKVVSS